MIATLLLALVPRADACGGMFCNAAQPVEQAAERIVFAWAEDEECPDGLVTVEVQISYVGDAADFGWVVPVPDVPELFASTDVLFTAHTGAIDAITACRKSRARARTRHV